MATTKPTMKDISNLETIFESDKVKAERGDLMYQGSLWTAGAYVITVKPHEHGYRRDSNGRLEQIKGQVKRFYGESAWNNAQRFAGDFDHDANYVSF